MRVPSMSILLYFTGEYYIRYTYYINQQEKYCMFPIMHIIKNVLHICVI